MKGDDPEIDTALTPKRFNGRLALREEIQKTFADSIPNNLPIKKGCNICSRIKINSDGQI